MGSSGWLTSIGELYGKLKKPHYKRDVAGPIAYWSPHSDEYILIPAKKAGILRKYHKHGKKFAYNFTRAARAGYIVHYRGYRKPCFGVDMDIIKCREYNQRVTPAVCLTRQLLYPRNQRDGTQLGEELDYLQRKYYYSRDEESRRYLRREIRKTKELFDPYPKCRGGCKMGRALFMNSCLGSEFDPQKESCNSCQDKIQCCQIMRIRIARILAGDRKEVEIELIECGALFNPTVQNLNYTLDGGTPMAKKKKTEEVVEKPIEQEIPEPEVKAEEVGKDLSRSEKRKLKREAEKKAAEVEKAKAEALAKGEDVEVSGLLGQLALAKKEKDQVTAMKIRARLRSKGYKIRDQKKIQAA